jgi:hypothetical protein
MKNVALTSDEAAKAAEEARAALERGDDPFGDDEPLVKNLTAAEADSEDEVESDSTPDAEVVVEEAEPVAIEDTAVRPTYESPEARDFDAERKALRQSKADVQKQWSDGELSDEEYSAKTSEVDDKLDTLLTLKVQAETIENLNRQAVIQTQQQALQAISAASKKAGELDYSDAKVATAYDRMLGAVMADPDNGGKAFAELAQLAHDALCTTRGVKRSVAQNTDAPKPRDTPKMPTTLRGLPNAASSNTGGDRLEMLGRLSGQAYQEAFNKLSPAEKASLLDE